jgi:histidine ammonia-lyase
MASILRIKRIKRKRERQERISIDGEKEYRINIGLGKVSYIIYCMLF